MSNNFGPQFKIAGEEDAKGIADAVADLRKVAEADLALGPKAIFYHSGHYNENAAAEGTVQPLTALQLRWPFGRRSVNLRCFNVPGACRYTEPGAG